VYAAVYVSCTRPCARPVHGRVVHVQCTGQFTRHVHDRRRPCRRPVHSHVHGWCRRAVCTAYTRPCTGRVYGRAVIRPCTGRFRRRRRVHGQCTLPPCNGHTTRYTAVYTAVSLHGRIHGRVHDTLHGRVHGPYAAAQRPYTRPWTARTQTCNCHVDFPCTPYTWRCNVCVHVSSAHGPCTRTWTGRVDGPCVYMAPVYGCLHGPYVYTARTRRYIRVKIIPTYTIYLHYFSFVNGRGV